MHVVSFSSSTVSRNSKKGRQQCYKLLEGEFSVVNTFARVEMSQHQYYRWSIRDYGSGRNNNSDNNLSIRLKLRTSMKCINQFTFPYSFCCKKTNINFELNLKNKDKKLFKNDRWKYSRTYIFFTFLFCLSLSLQKMKKEERFYDSFN